MGDLIKRTIEEMSCFGGFVFFVFMCLFLLLTKNNATFVRYGVALLVGMAIIVTIRTIYHRIRPQNINRGIKHFRSFLEKIDDASFPSMHSMTVIVAAYTLFIFNNALWPVSLLIAVSVFISRKMLKKHYWSDIVVGAVIGLLCAFGSFYFI